jgi:thioredoxin-related protein
MGKRVLMFCFYILSLSVNAQDKETINWLSFEELETQFNKAPKKVFINFYTDWCSYCKKMERKVYTKPEVIHILNNDYYAVRFDAESAKEFQFGGKRFINDQVGKSRNPLHQMAQLLALRDNQFVAPTLVVLDKDFKITARYFEYMTSDELVEILK